MKKFLFSIINVFLSFFKKNEPSFQGKNVSHFSRYSDILDELTDDFEESNFENLSNPSGARLSAAVNRDGVIKHTGAIGRPGFIPALIAQSKGDLNITVTRTGVTIAQNLPYVVFGLNDYASGYASTLAGFLPSGVTVAVTVNSVGSVVFTYTSGLNSDTITVANIGNNNYISFLQSMNQNRFKTKYMLYTISAAQPTQFNQMLNYGLLSSLGAKNSNQLLLNSRILPDQYLTDRVNVLMPEQEVTPDFSFVQNMIQVSGLVVGYNIFMSERLNSNKNF